MQFHIDLTNQMPGALARVGNRTGTFTGPEWSQWIENHETSLSRESYSDSLPGILDWSCPSVVRAILVNWDVVKVDGREVFNDSVLRSECLDLTVENEEIQGGLARGSQIAELPWRGAESHLRIGNYKMVGRSWNDRNWGLFRSWGSETTFHNFRKRWRFGETRWWHLDASRLEAGAARFHCRGVACLFGQFIRDGGRRDDEITISSRNFIIHHSCEHNETDSTSGYWCDQFSPGEPADAVMGFHKVRHGTMVFRLVTHDEIPSGAVIIDDQDSRLTGTLLALDRSWIPMVWPR